MYISHVPALLAVFRTIEDLYWPQLNTYIQIECLAPNQNLMLWSIILGMSYNFVLVRQYYFYHCQTSSKFLILQFERKSLRKILLGLGLARKWLSLSLQYYISFRKN